ncbi:MAG: hypothetical protein FWG45_01595 [Oscillospiraceae bacterium]|nr:hypothetical protein [Oscillospiraceae bacterium]
MKNGRATNKAVIDFTDDTINCDGIASCPDLDINNIEEVYASLAQSRREVARGGTIPAEIVFEEIRRLYGFSS